jgi:hypothetical protein
MLQGEQASYPPVPFEFPVITDATRFFDHHEFPSIRLKASEADVARAFYYDAGVVSINDAMANELASIQDRLRPHMRADRLARPLPVRIEMKDLSQVPRLLSLLCNTPSLYKPIARSPAESVLVHVWVSYLQDAKTLCLADRRLVIKTLELTNKDNLEKLPNLRPLFQVVAARNRTPYTCARVQTLCLRRESLSAALLAMACSALPHSQTFSVLHIMAPVPGKLYRPRNRGCRIKDLHVRPFTALDWAWLGYAIFHPDATDSTWHSLDINVDSIAPDALHVLSLMARGNNLAAVASKSHATICESYNTVRLRSKTVVYSLSARDADVLYETETAVSACESNPPNVPDGWVRIVAPGHGFGWVHASSITAKSSRTPSGARLRGLRLHASVAGQIPTALAFVALIGGNLQWLDVSNCSALGASQLQTLLTALPALKSLTMEQCSTTWLDPLPPTARMLRLEELSTKDSSELHVPHPSTLTTVLSELRALRWIAPTPRLRYNNTAVFAYVEALPQLTYFHWSERRRASTYCRGRAATHKKLGGHITALRMARCRRAFLSVARLNQDVCALIFSFVPDYCAIQLWIGM